jgi:hypothetical protein
MGSYPKSTRGRGGDELTGERRGGRRAVFAAVVAFYSAAPVASLRPAAPPARVASVFLARRGVALIFSLPIQGLHPELDISIPAKEWVSMGCTGKEYPRA